MTQREKEAARVNLERYKAEQLSTLAIAESAVDTAEQAEMEKKRTGAVAISAKVRRLDLCFSGVFLLVSWRIIIALSYPPLSLSLSPLSLIHI